VSKTLVLMMAKAKAVFARNAGNFFAAHGCAAGSFKVFQPQDFLRCGVAGPSVASHF
jgi:hypothetical protein